LIIDTEQVHPFSGSLGKPQGQGFIDAINGKLSEHVSEPEKGNIVCIAIFGILLPEMTMM